jgi:hypothetical protein
MARSNPALWEKAKSEAKAKMGDILELNAGYSTTLSVDRVDSSKGYTKDNVVLTTWEVNNCKQDLDLKDFAILCEKVLKNVQN